MPRHAINYGPASEEGSSLAVWSLQNGAHGYQMARRSDSFSVHAMISPDRKTRDCRMPSGALQCCWRPPDDGVTIGL